jgi:dodecin
LARVGREAVMAESVYTVIELIGTSTESWEKAAAAAVKTASQSLRDLRVAEVVELDMQLDNGKVTAYRAKVKVSFKYETSAKAPAKKAAAKRR